MKPDMKVIRAVIVQLILTALAMLAVTVNPLCTDITDLFREYDYRDILLFMGLWLIFTLCDRVSSQGGDTMLLKCVCGILSLFLSVILIAGDSFMYSNSLELMTGGAIRWAASLIRLAGYLPFFYRVFHALFIWLDTALPGLSEKKGGAQKGLFGAYLKLLSDRPVLTSFCTMWVLYLPMLITCYPGLMMGDTGDQLAQGANLMDFHPYVRLISEEVKLFDHHPVVHTKLLWLCVHLGQSLTGSWNAGAYTYCLVQMAITLLCYALALGILLRDTIRPVHSVWIMVYLLYCPAMAHTLMVMSKDIIYTGFLMLFMAALYGLLRRDASRGILCEFILSMLGILAFRKEGVYIVLLTLFMAFLTKALNRRRCALLFVSVVILHLLWGDVLLPALKVSPGSKREAMSMPFQMTARYIVQYGDEVTDEERAAIDGVLDYDQVAELYNPTRCIVKKLYREDATREDMSAYIKSFFSMFLKHPNVYLIAAANFKFRYFYPSPIDESSYDLPYSDMWMGIVNGNMAEAGLETDFHYPKGVLTYLRDIETAIWDMLKGLPVLRILFSTSTYIWAVIIAVAYALLRRNGHMLTLLMPLVTTILVIMAGPRGGGHNRYIIPLAVCIPAVSFMLSRMSRGRRA